MKAVSARCEKLERYKGQPYFYPGNTSVVVSTFTLHISTEKTTLITSQCYFIVQLVFINFSNI